jgi:hypothetical protein
MTRIPALYVSFSVSSSASGLSSAATVINLRSSKLQYYLRREGLLTEPHGYQQGYALRRGRVAIVQRGQQYARSFWTCSSGLLLVEHIVYLLPEWHWLVGSMRS